MATFGISVFPSPQHIIALASGLFEYPSKSIAYLQNLLLRTKNPPLSVMYTIKFLDNSRSTQQHSLDIIRFLSHLSDLSQSSPSMQSSLNNVISQTSFLIEVRHSLTHKAMVEKHVIEVSKKIILNDLRGKYWEPLCDKVLSTYNLELSEIANAYEQIFQKQLDEEGKNKLSQKLRASKIRVTGQWLINTCGNYQFKQFLPIYISNYSKPEVLQLLGRLPDHKWAIATNYLLKQFIYKRRNQDILDLVSMALKGRQQAILKEKLILRKLRQISFNHYLGYSKRLLDELPLNVQEYLSEYWRVNEQSNLKIYKKYQTNKSKAQQPAQQA